MDWKDVIEPACRQAAWGLPIDWYSASKINNFMRGLSVYEETRKTYFRDGFPPVLDLEGGINSIPLGRLAETYRRLQTEGPESYYQGELGEQIANDLREVGSRISLRDLNEYEAFIAEPLHTHYRDADIYVAGNLTAGPSIVQALNELGSSLTTRTQPNSETYKA